MEHMVSRRRWMGTIAGALALVAATAGCDNKGQGAAGPPDSSGKANSGAPVTEWRVGAYFSLSGAETQFGVDTKEGIELAVDEVNKAGGAKGKPVKVLFE